MISKQKIIYAALLVLTVGLSFFAWQNLKQLLFDGSVGNEVFLVVAQFLFVSAVFAAIILLFDSWPILLAAPAVILAIYFVLFGFHWAHLAVFAGGTGLMAAGIAEAKKEKGLHIKIMPFEITKPATSMLFTVLAAAVSVVIYFSPPVQGLGVEIKVPRAMFDLVLTTTTGFLTVPLETGSQTLVNIPGLPPMDLKEMDRGLKDGNIDVNQVFSPQVRDKIYSDLNQQINTLFGRYKRYLPYGLAIAVFLTLRTFGFIFVWLAGILTQIFFVLMKALKMVNIRKEMVEKETIEISPNNQ